MDREIAAALLVAVATVVAELVRRRYPKRCGPRRAAQRVFARERRPQR